MHSFSAARKSNDNVRMSRIRCPRCARPATHCLCATIPRLPSRTRVVILQHPDEARHPLNTARLAALALQAASLRQGTAFGPSDWEVPGLPSWLLFPGPQARVLEPGAPGMEGGVLVVPDASWRKARGLLHRSPALAALPRVMLPPGLPARYRIRHADEAGALSTLEAIAHALDLIEAPASFGAMLQPLDAMVQAQIDAMGPERYRRHHVLRQGTRTKPG